MNRNNLNPRRIDKLRFPDLKGLVAYAHSLKLQVGFCEGTRPIIPPARSPDYPARRRHGTDGPIDACSPAWRRRSAHKHTQRGPIACTQTSTRASVWRRGARISSRTWPSWPKCNSTPSRSTSAARVRTCARGQDARELEILSPPKLVAPRPPRPRNVHQASRLKPASRRHRIAYRTAAASFPPRCRRRSTRCGAGARCAVSPHPPRACAAAPVVKP